MYGTIMVNYDNYAEIIKIKCDTLNSDLKKCHK